MIAVFYQFRLKAGCEKEYQQCWKTVVCYFKKECGAIGSCLHKTDDGLWIAYSRWPSKEARDQSWPGEKSPSTELPDQIYAAILKMRECVEAPAEEICTEIVEDFMPVKSTVA